MLRIVSSVSFVVTLTAVLVACSDHVEKTDTCAERPNAKGCKKAGGATASTPYEQTPVTANTPTVPPAGADGGTSDGAPPAAPTKPKVPPANAACTDLTRCCAQVKDSLERVGCMAIVANTDASQCANAMIAYQVFGGCGHASSLLPDIFGSDKTPKSTTDCRYLERACIQDPSACDAAYRCNGVSVGGTETSSDPCDSAPDPYCCRYPNTFDCGGSPAPVDPCDSAPDPYCCRYPNTFDCSGSPAPVDPCDSAPDPYCCKYPNSFDCAGSPPPVDPCDNAFDPYCCKYPNSFDCGGF